MFLDSYHVMPLSPSSEFPFPDPRRIVASAVNRACHFHHKTHLRLLVTRLPSSFRPFFSQSPTTTSTSNTTSVRTETTSASNATMASLNQVKLSNSTLASITIREAKLVNCTFTRATIHNSSISSSTLINCRLYDCIIHSSTLSKCKLYGLNQVLKCEIEGSELLPTQPTLSTLPVEIREMIFELCLRNAWVGKTMPNLIVALRGHEELYFQALDVFRKTNSFWLNGNSIKLFKGMRESVLSNIRRVGIKSVTLAAC